MLYAPFLIESALYHIVEGVVVVLVEAIQRKGHQIGKLNQPRSGGVQEDWNAGTPPERVSASTVTNSLAELLRDLPRLDALRAEPRWRKVMREWFQRRADSLKVVD
jgi:hypothetical protein